MNDRRKTIPGAWLLVLVSSGASAQGLVECPVPEIEARVTTKLPGDWWATPQVGKLVGTEVAKVGGDLTLICSYWAYGTDVSVMRKAPENMGCIAKPTGFECSRSTPQTASRSRMTEVTGGFKADAPGTRITNDAIKVQGGVSGSAPGTAVVDTKRPDAGKSNPGKGPSVRSGGSCTDPMLDGIEVRYVTRDPASNTYAFRLVGIVRNAGGMDFSSSPGQQVLELHRVPRGGSANRLNRWDFGNIPAGGESSEYSYDVLKWSLGDEFPPGFRFSIDYEPDISADGNSSNDDCRMGNNATTISGEDINAIIRASGT